MKELDGRNIFPFSGNEQYSALTRFGLSGLMSVHMRFGTRPWQDLLTNSALANPEQHERSDRQPAQGRAGAARVCGFAGGGANGGRRASIDGASENALRRAVQAGTDPAASKIMAAVHDMATFDRVPVTFQSQRMVSRMPRR